MYPRIFENQRSQLKNCWNWGMWSRILHRSRWDEITSSRLAGNRNCLILEILHQLIKTTVLLEVIPPDLPGPVKLLFRNFDTPARLLLLYFVGGSESSSGVLINRDLAVCVLQPPAGRCWEMRTGTRCQQDLGCTVGNLLNNEHCAGTERQGTMHQWVSCL